MAGKNAVRWIQDHPDFSPTINTDKEQLAREMKASDSWSAIPIIVVSASVMRQEHVKAREAGCEFFIEKPFDIDNLRSIVAKAVDDRACAP